MTYYTQAHNITESMKPTHTVTLYLVPQNDYTVLPDSVTLVRLDKLDTELLKNYNALQFTCLREFVNLCYYRHDIARVTRTRCI